MQVEVLDSQQLIFTVHDFLSAEECKSFIEFSERHNYAPAPLTTSRGPVMDPEIRNNDRVMVDDAGLAQRFWARLAPLVPRLMLDWEDAPRLAVGLNERFRFFRYAQNQRFAKHYDGAFVRNPHEASLLSFMVYLNEDFGGGETRFYTDNGKLRQEVRPRTGKALVFLHEQYHEGCRVLERGAKYVMRSDVMYRKR